MVARGMLLRKHHRYPMIPETASMYVEALMVNELMKTHLKAQITDERETIAALFCSTEMIETLHNFDTICYDGTFFIVPKIFTQLFIISVRIGPRMLPTFFVLMKTRQYHHYKLVMAKIKELVPQFNPIMAIGDFEKAPIRALREEFNEINCQGCYFHFKQAVVRKLGELGLKNFYTKNNQFNKLMNLVMTLGFLPNDKIMIVFNELKDFHIGSSDQQNKIEVFFDNFNVYG